MHDPFDYFHVVFDWNGTVIEDIGLAVTSINAIRTSLGLADVTLEDYSFHFGGAGAETQGKPDAIPHTLSRSTSAKLISVMLNTPGSSIAASRGAGGQPNRLIHRRVFDPASSETQF
jgi:phosphoglycolate phosphatase-like HAD superfamily hydrolase